MGLRAADQHLTVYVSREAAALTVPAADIMDDLVFLPASITYTSSIGNGFPTVAAALADAGDGISFSILYKDLNSDIFRQGPLYASDQVEPWSQKTYTAPVEQIDEMQIPGTVVAGDQYILRLAVPNYAEMISQQDEVYFYGSYTAKTGDTATMVALALGASLKARLDSLPSAIADVTWAADTVTVTALPQTYVQSKFDGKQVNFHLTLASPDSLLADRTSHTAPNPGFGTYNQVASMEEFYAGYASDWLNRTANFPGDGNPSFAAEVGGTYNSSVFVFNKGHRDVQVGRQRQTVACYFKQ